MEQSRFFDNSSYPAEKFTDFFNSLINDGVVRGQKQELQVIGEGSSMKTVLGSGNIFIGGKLYINTQELQLSHSPADISNNRIDRIIIELDLVNKEMKSKVIEGISSPSPVPASLIRDIQNSGIYQISLAQVLILAGKSYIETSEITDERDDYNVCGYSTQNLKDIIPSGAMVYWKGSLADIPHGWFLCNGTSGTPNLVDTFILGAGNDDEINQLGGSNSKTLTVNQLPSHDHGGSVGNADSHNHVGSSVSSGGSHRHSVYCGYGAVKNGYLPFGQDSSTIYTGYSEYAGTHSHTATLNSSGTHSHTLSIDNFGPGLDFDITPKYYKLAVIMKG